MLQRRCVPEFNRNAFKIQSPAYVGCAHQVKRRMLDHDPDLDSLAGSSNMPKLTIACIRYMGLKPVVHTTPIVMVWKDSQISLSEILVTVLAQSLASLDGFNIS